MGKGWKNSIKAEQAAKKGKAFTKVAREIAVAARLGGPDPEGNSRLKMAIAAAREVSCPKDTIERALKKGAGQSDDGAQIEELTYEGLGPSGVGIIVECQTDNRNRTVSELRSIFRSHDGSLGETNSVLWMFDRVAILIGEKSNVGDPEEEAIEVGANEVEKNDDGSFSFFASATDLDAVRTSLVARGWDVKMAERGYRPKNKTEASGDTRKLIDDLVVELDDFDDSHRIYTTLG